ncbi:SOS response-associated peptidase [Roseobacter sp. SK209-2-6]|uniref:SOS response-associated peptidase n=1 Tax=Roseobacter sp. SK209-2-6 TaxID=388739 RepID=UPI000A0651E9|nr:SOS response-associated peptidase [Roseobacter sp. SK209-2-6]
MCGRLAVTLPGDAMAQLFASQPANNLPQVPNYNVCPTNQLHVVISAEETRQLVAMRWGFLPHWYESEGAGPLLINARAETIAKKPAFAEACRSRRCLIPASGFYEWTKDAKGNRLPWYVSRKDAAPIAFGGIWQAWGKDEPVKTCAIVTTAANQSLGHIHHRMPLMLAQEDWALWLGEAERGAARLMQPGDEELFQAWRVDVKVNGNKAQGAELIEPFDVIEEQSDPSEAQEAAAVSPMPPPKQGRLF